MWEEAARSLSADDLKEAAVSLCERSETLAERLETMFEELKRNMRKEHVSFEAESSAERMPCATIKRLNNFRLLCSDFKVFQPDWNNY